MVNYYASNMYKFQHNLKLAAKANYTFRLRCCVPYRLHRSLGGLKKDTIPKCHTYRARHRARHRRKPTQPTTTCSAARKLVKSLISRLPSGACGFERISRSIGRAFPGSPGTGPARTFHHATMVRLVALQTVAMANGVNSLKLTPLAEWKRSRAESQP